MTIRKKYLYISLSFPLAPVTWRWPPSVTIISYRHSSSGLLRVNCIRIPSFPSPGRIFASLIDRWHSRTSNNCHNVTMKHNQHGRDSVNIEQFSQSLNKLIMIGDTCCIKIECSQSPHSSDSLVKSPLKLWHVYVIISHRQLWWSVIHALT